jgi:hypothetical protein
METNLIKFLKEEFNNGYFYYKLETNKGVIHVDYTHAGLIVCIYTEKFYNVKIVFTENKGIDFFLKILKNDFKFNKILIFNILLKDEY